MWHYGNKGKTVETRYDNEESVGRKAHHMAKPHKQFWNIIVVQDLTRLIGRDSDSGFIKEPTHARGHAPVVIWPQGSRHSVFSELQ